jgi:OPA family sugar phosphate sensor protein UhpC-like MFS transporter
MGLVAGMLGFFRTRPDLPVLEDPKQVHRVYEWRRWSVFLSLLFGYSFYYVCRSSINVVKKPIIDSGVLNAEQLGNIGFALFITYAFGKITNGFLADRSHIGRFMATGLLVSAVTLILFGFSQTFWVFLLLWGVHGWFQSMGSAPSGASLSQWFSNRERGTRYGIWSMSHSIGEGLTFAITAVVVTYFGWRFGLWGAGALSLAVALVLYKTLADRPQTYGLPAVADYKNDHAAIKASAQENVGRAQLEVLKNPYVWLLGFSCVAMYTARYGINSWGVIYLQEANHYSLITAGMVMFWAKISELVGTVASGFISDRLFGARRNVTTLMYGLLEVTGLVILFLAPSTYMGALDSSLAEHLEAGPVQPAVIEAVRQHGVELAPDTEVFEASKGGQTVWLVRRPVWGGRWTGLAITQTDTQLNLTKAFRYLHLLGAALFGFGQGGMLVFLGGLIAIDICSKKASGAAMGFVGMFSYIGAAFEERISGRLLETGKTVVYGQATHDFTWACSFWLSGAVLAVLLSCCLWRVKARD